MVLFLAKARVSRRQYAESSSTHDTVVIPIKRTLVRALGINAVDHQPAKMMRSQSPKASCFSRIGTLCPARRLEPVRVLIPPTARLWVSERQQITFAVRPDSRGENEGFGS